MVIEASDIIKPEHTDEYLNNALNSARDPRLDYFMPNTAHHYKLVVNFLLSIPAPYRSSAMEQVNNYTKTVGANLEFATIVVKKELDFQLAAPTFDLSDEEIQQQREDLDYLNKYAMLSAGNVSTTMPAITEHQHVNNIVRAAIGTLLANGLITVNRDVADWIKLGYPQHLM